MRRVLIGLLIVLVLLAATALVIAPVAAPRLIAWQLRSLGLDESMVEDAAFGVNEVALGEVRLTDGLTARRVVLAYAPLDLLRGRLGQLLIKELRVEAVFDPEDGLRVPGLDLASGGGDDGALPLLPEAIRIEDALLNIELPGGGLAIEADATLDVVGGAPDRFEIQARRISGALGGGTISGRLTLGGEVEPFADDPVATLAARGSGSFEARQMALGAWSLTSFTGALETAFGDAVLTLTLERLTAQVQPAEGPELLEALGVDGPLTVSVPGQRAAVLALDTEERAGRLSLPAHVATGGPSADLDLELRYALTDGPQPVEVSDLTLQIEARDLLVGPTIESVRLELAGHGTPAVAALDGQLTLAGRGSAGGIAADELELALPLAIEVAPERIQIALDDAGSLVADGVAVPAAEARGRFRVTLPAAPVFELERAAAWRWRLDLPLRLEDLEATAAGVSLGGAAGRLRVMASGRGTAPEALDLQLAEGALRLPDPAVALEGVRAEVALDPAGAISGPVAFAVENVRSLATPAPFAPFKVDGIVRVEQDRVAFESMLARPGIELDVDGHRRLDRPAGRASLELQPVQFVPGGLQPADLVPLAAGLLEEVTGEVSLSGVVAIDSPRLASDLGIVLQDLGFGLGPLRIEGLNGVVEVDQLSPPATLPGQLLTIALVDFGLVFTDGRMRFELLPGGPLEVRRLNFAWSGGQVAARPFTVGSADGVISVTLEARGLDLGRMFAEVKLPGLEGQGTIDGVLPVRLENGEASIENGKLTARRAGWLRYRPEDPPDALAAGGESMALLLQALEDFRYDELEITLDGRTDQAMDIRLHLKGANPELYGGHPIEFNLNLEGELANILREGLRSYTLPDRVREQIERSRSR